MPAKTLNLVIVDDDSVIVCIVEHMLRTSLPEQFRTVAFTDPRAALEWIEVHGCDVLLSDVEMPWVGGLELLRAGIKRNAAMETVFLTAHSSWDRVAEAIELGASDYLLKPVDRAQLIGLLQQKHGRLSRSPVEVREVLDPELDITGVAPSPAPA